MDVLVAGATGAIGHPLTRQLVARGHRVVGLTRQPGHADSEKATLVTCDLFDRTAVLNVVAQHRPDAIIAQPTQLPKDFKPRELEAAYAKNNKVRFEGTRNLLAAAEASKVKTFIAQSSAFWYAPTPGDVKTESAAFWTEAPEPIGEAVRTMVRTEELVAAAKGPTPILLRYAGFYGPRTWFAREGTIGRLALKRQYPILGGGSAVQSFLHVEDAASATVAALEHPHRGTFNVADDEPAPARDWLPRYCEALGAKPPRRIPVWLAKLAIGPALATYTANTRGADNRLIKETFRWAPRYPSWRTGFREDLG